MKLKRGSHSAFNTALKCGQQYKFRYAMGLRLPPGFAIIRGRGADEGVNTNLVQKIESKKDADRELVRAAAAGEVDRMLAGEVVLDPDYMEYGFERAKGVVKDEAITLAELHLHRVAPELQPRAVQVKIEMPPSEVLPLTMVGVVDVIDDADVIHDTKTSKKSPPATAADESDQLTWYELFHRARYRKPSAGQRLDYLVRTPKGNLSAKVLETTRTMEDLQRAVATAGEILRMIEAEVWVPAPDSAWWCSAKWCGYHPDAGGPCRYGRRTKRPTT